MITSKITEIKEVKPYTNEYGTTFYHNLVMDNGDKINIGKKSECKVGWELTYEIIGDEQQEYRKAKAVQKEQGNYTPKPSTDNLKGIKIGHAITNAVNLHISQGSSQENQNIKDSIKDYAKLIYDISEELNTEI